MTPSRIRGDLAWGAALVVVLAAVYAGPLLARDPGRTVGAGYQPAGPGFPFGTDGVGRDVLQRVLTGGADLVTIGAVSTVVAVVVGTVLGLVLALPSWPGRVLGVALDVVLVVPAMLTLLVLVFGLGAGTMTMVVVTTVVCAPFVARLVRSLTVPLLRSPFVLAARAAGDSWPSVMAREIAPNLLPPLAAEAGLRFVGGLYLIASAGFLGFSPLGSDQDWATMVQSGLDGIRLNPWAALAPALAVAAVTVPASVLVDRATRRLR